MIRAGYELLDLLTFFTAGKDEVRAWTIEERRAGPRRPPASSTPTSRRASSRPRSSGGRTSCKLGGESKCRDAGKLAIEGKDYVVRDGDVMHFRFNV